MPNKIKTIQVMGLESGKVYYFDVSKESWGTFVKEEDSAVFFKDCENKGGCGFETGSTTIGFHNVPPQEYLEKTE